MKQERIRMLEEKLPGIRRMNTICGWLVAHMFIQLLFFIVELTTDENTRLIEYRNTNDLVTRFFICISPIFMLVVILLCITSSQSYSIKSELKNMYILEAIEKQGLQPLEYSAEGFSENEIKSLDLFRMGNRFSSCDKVSFVYNDMRITRGDVYIAREETKTRTVTDSDGKTKEETYTETTVYFRGTVYIFGKGYPHIAQVNVQTNSFEGTMRAGKAIKMDNVQFNKKMKVRTKDELDAFRLLKPQNMENFLQLWDQRKHAFGIGVRESITIIAENRKGRSFVLDNADFMNGIDESKVIEKLSRNCLDFMTFYDALLKIQ